MSPEQIAGLAPALTEFLGGFRNCLGECRLLGHFATYCRGLLSNLQRKSVEPIALAAGSTVRALQLFLTHRVWDHRRLRDRLQQRIAALHTPAPGTIRPSDDLGVIGLIDETSVAKKGDKTPGVQRQYCGASGKIENCIVTVHLGCCHGPHGQFKALLDSDLFLPKNWSDNRQRCREADIPEDLLYRPKTAIALDQVRHALGNGIAFDWLVFDEGYGKDPSFLYGLDELGRTWIGEVPKSFRCWPTLPQYRSLRREFASKKVENVVRWSPAFIYQDWQAITFPRQTVEPIVWDVKAAQVYLAKDGHPTDRTYWLIVAWNRGTGEYKYFLSNAPPRTKLDLLLKVAFRRADIEHLFRLAKDEVGLDHFEGRSYVGLMRHMILCQLTLLFLAEQTARLNAEVASAAQPPLEIQAERGEKEKETDASDARRNSAQDQSSKAPTPQAAHLDSDPTAPHHGANRGLAELAVCPLA
jgi:SRSO17 transposase